MPSRLAVFAYERDTGLPLARLPCYAEVVVRVPDGAGPVTAGRELDDAIAVVLREDDPENVADDAVRSRLTAVVEQELLRHLGPDAVEEFQREPDGAREFLRGVVRIIREAAGERALSDLPAEEFRQLVADAVRAQAVEVGLVPAPTTEPGTVVWAYPLGVVATDHVGYLSYDLTRLPPAVADAVQVALKTRRQDPGAPRPAALLLYPMGTAEPIDAFSQGRGRPDCVVAKLELARPGALEELPGLGMPAMQDPGLPDWRLSPSSFAQNPASLVGEDGCESLLPANVALQEQYLYQIVRLTDLQQIVPAAAQDRITLGVVNDYRVAWYPLGHSLGQLLYSLPLAPGESVNLAVVDWTRRDDAQRQEQTTLDEQLVHDEHRDRTISETVDAAVHEYQRGSSFMGGVAGAAGGSMGGMVSGGIAGSLGGATSNSSGVRDVSSDTVQKVSDNISQVSAAKRELQSTVIVHGTQAEREAIETRTVVNYNHSHALTILYYEVLKQFRVVTELSRRRPAVLVKMPTDVFTTGDPAKAAAREHRSVLEAALLDGRVAAGFAALERIEERRRLAVVLAPPPQPPPPPPGPGERTFVFFMFEMTTGGMFSAPMDDHGNYTDVVATILRTPASTDIELLQADGGNVLSHRGSFRQGGVVDKFGVALPNGAVWKTFTAFSFWINPQGGSDQFVSFAHIKVTGIDGNGDSEVLIDEGYEGGHLIVMDEGATIVLPTRRPPPSPAPTPRPAQEVQDDADSTALLAHLAEHSVYYSRAVTLGQNAAERTNALAAMTFPDGSSVADKVDPRPLEMVGNQVAYACTDPAWSEQMRSVLADQPTSSESFDERLVGLPTRGVFAEAKLGHCNASELIDNTRFWDWQQSPVPHLAPEISPITAVTPQPVQQGLTSTGFPASLVNIVNPPSAPDPTGTAAALALLGTSNIFRDMSGRAEVADILKNLADNAVKVAGGPAGGASRTPSASSGGGGAAGGGTGAARGAAAVGGQRATPTQPSATNRDLQDLQQVLGQAQGSGLITPGVAQQAYGTALQSALQPEDLKTVGDRYAPLPVKVTPNQLIGLVGEQHLVDALKADGLVVFSDWSKSVAANGFDLIAFDPVSKTVWLIDNKSQLRGVGSAASLTGPQFEGNLADARKFLSQTHPDIAHAGEAVAALDLKHYERVVGNAWSGNATTFTENLMKTGVSVYDVRLRRLFLNYNAWRTAFLALPKLPGRIGLRGTAVFEGGFFVLTVAAGALWLMRGAQNISTALGEIAAETVLGAVLNVLPGGFFAGMVIGLETDNPYLLAAQRRQATIDSISEAVPGFASMSVADQAAVRKVAASLVDDPLQVQVPEPPAGPKQLLPGFTSPLAPTDWA